MPSRIFALLLAGVLTFGCSEEPKEMVVEGILLKASDAFATTYQYGSYGIAPYALRSQTLDLEAWVNQQVRVVGTPIEGYPLSGGPEYLEVVSIRSLP